MTTTKDSGTGNTAQDIRFHELLALAFKEPGTISAAYSMFWDYSLGNQIAAMFQCAERGVVPGPIATFPRWRDLGRHVKKGAKAISLCMPVGGSREVRNTESGEVERVGFTRFIWRRNWFVLSQTDGAAFTPPTPPTWDRAQAIATLGVTEIPFEMMSGNCQGYAKETSISISPIAAHPFKTLFHELAHVLLGHTAESQLSDDETTPRTLREVEAESVAMLVCDALGLPGAEQSRGYIQAWGSRGGIADVPEKSAQKIMHAADKILRAGRGETVERRARSEKQTSETTTPTAPQLTLALA